MSIYIVGQIVNCELKLKILRAFVVDGEVYYIFTVVKKETPLRYIIDKLYGVLNVDGNCEGIPMEAFAKAELLIQQENLMDKME